MVCPKCGRKCPEGERFCTECGAALNQTEIPSSLASQNGGHCPRCGVYMSGSMTKCPGCGFAPSPTMPFPVYRGPTDATSMAWVQFILDFLIWAEMALWAAAGILYMIGIRFEWNLGERTFAMLLPDKLRDYYASNSAYRLTMIIHGAVYLLLAAGCIYTFMLLKEYRKHAPLLFLTLHLTGGNFASIFLSLISVYNYANGAADKAFANNVLLGLYLIPLAAGYINVFYIILNYLYFKKREHLYIY